MRIGNVKCLHTGLLACFLLASLGQLSQAELFINEIYFDPPGGLDSTAEYLEFRGTPGMSLANHYLIFLESETSQSANTGEIDNLYDLGNFTIGSNGFLVLRQKNSPHTVVPGANDFVNQGPDLPPVFGQPRPPGYGSGVNSTIGASDIDGDGVTENGAFSALLIRNDSGPVPALALDLDGDNDGQMDEPDGQGGLSNVATGRTGWTIIDSVGQSEPNENNIRFYSAINFQETGTVGSTVQAGGVIVNVPYENELLARWGNSTGSTEADWHTTNLTDKNASGSGFQGPADFRQSGDPHPTFFPTVNDPAQQPPAIESNKGVPYGTILLDNIGGPNYITGDYNDDGFVDPSDYAAWRNSLGTVGTQLAHPAADNNHDFIVDGLDLQIWRDNFAGTQGSLPGAILSEATTSAVPEPTTTVLISILAASFGACRSGRRS